MAQCSVESEESDIEVEIREWKAGGDLGDEDNVRKFASKLWKRDFYCVDRLDV